MTEQNLDATRAVRWRLHAWQSPSGNLYRHWFDPELAIAWANRFLGATSLYDQLFCWARWIEAANLGPYALRRVGADPTSAPLSTFCEMAAGKYGLPFPPAALCAAAPRREMRNGMINEYVYAGRPVTRRWWQFGAVETDQRTAPFEALTCAVSGSNRDQYNNALFERRLIALLSDFGGDTADAVGKIKRVAGDWIVFALPRVPKLSIALRWTPVALDGFYDVVWIDEDEGRLRSSACFADMQRSVPVDAYLAPDSPAVSRIDTPLASLPDLAMRRDEVMAFTLNPSRWLELYTDAVIRRNQQWLARVAPELAASASSASQSRSAAMTASSAALNTLNTLNKNELTRQITDVAGTLEMLPIIGQIAGAVLKGIATFLSGVGMFDLPPEQKAELVRQTVAPLSISGAAAADDAKSEPPSHAVAIPAGWARPPSETAMPTPPFRTVIVDASTPPLDPAQAIAAQAPRKRGIGTLLVDTASSVVISREARYAQIYPADVSRRALAVLEGLDAAQPAQAASGSGGMLVAAVGLTVAAGATALVLMRKKR